MGALLGLALEEGHILNLCIDKPWQGKGLGNLLLVHLHSHISQLSAKYCFLEVRKSNHIAIRLYQKFNYQVIGIRKNYYPTTEGREDGIVMKKTL